ncbi:DNA-directed RNA polymerase III subunit C11 [Talaromyces islandicus]|uniref:DNA-directed RNA polymerase subunit n=1 Tax=Talaromyces islandicus TaxID=28573 RepID=A0A0U1LRG5_TALIS|nr:DNA-directed RNA polymerase III subunit C11 [Talaromyces islandicus]
MQVSSFPLYFCPNCSNALTISRAEGGLNRFECRACPYQYAIDISYYEQRTLKQKEVEPVFGGKKSHENADRMAAQCPSETCNGEQAYFFQLQIRSADEPMTTFLECTTCKKTWREN